jgi:hypothetical protein
MATFTVAIEVSRNTFRPLRRASPRSRAKTRNFAYSKVLSPATIVTSDVNDITHSLKSAKLSHALFGARGSAAAQIIIIKV